MRRRLVSLCLLVSAFGCTAGLDALPPDSRDSAGPDTPFDAGVDAELGAFARPTPLLALPEGLERIDDPTLSADRREMYFEGDADIYVVRRASQDDPWGAPEKVVELSTEASETDPELSFDGLSISITRTTDEYNMELYVATRPDPASPWGAPARLAEIDDGSTREAGGVMDESGTLLVFARSTDSDSWELFAAEREDTTQTWESTQWLREIGSPRGDGNPYLSADGLTLYFTSNRTENDDIYAAHRRSSDDTFADPQPLTGINTTSDESDPWLSRDQRSLVFVRDAKEFLEAYR